MLPQLKKAEYVGDYRIKVNFDDGKEGVINMEEELWGEVFEPLKDQSLFSNFVVNSELHTIEWPSTGADLAPEFLYEKTIA